eukprot:TRINITY_DN8965_c0_g1_i1.p1 TRINITY_DN8965_c0_g1~~TRINITY_DN8965_c0_g1_i1.p1  ORF type:complete len:238 (-),score=12.73 TRINITY_DN8965_c0_g1_i1:438-1061(-)
MGSMGILDHQRTESMKSASSKSRKRRFWNLLRMTIFMIRRGLLMRKEDLHLLMKKGKMAVGKNLRSLPFHHHHNQKNNSLGIPKNHPFQGYYEFSCSNSPAFFKGFQRTQRLPFHYFSSCIHPPEADETPSPCFTDFRFSMSNNSNNMDGYELAAGEDLVSTPHSQSGSGEADKDAEEFIANFYKEMKFQRQISFLKYQEMLERGAS